MLKLQLKDKDNQQFDLVAARLSIGRDAGNDVVLDDPGISGFHAEIQVQGHRLFLVDLGSTNGTFINGKRISGRQELKAWDAVRFDLIEAEVLDTEGVRPTVVRPAVGARAATQVRPAAATEVLPSGERSAAEPRPRLAGDTQAFDLTGPMTVGRGKDCDILIDDASISSSHARVAPADGGWVVEDLKSTNGVFVNEARVTRAALKHGDKVRFGKVGLRFEIPGAEVKTEVLPAASTAVMTAATSVTAHEARTVVSAPAQPAMPAWLYAVIGFLVVGIGASVYLFRDSLFGGGAEQFRLQASKVWVRPLPAGRNAPATPLIADINNDKYLDVIVGDGGGFVLALDGVQGKLIYETALNGHIVAPLASADFNGDGIPEVVAATDTGQVAVVAFIADEAKVLWKSPDDLRAGVISNRPVTSDVNGDGVPDVLVPTADRGLVALDGVRGWELWNTAESTTGKIVTRPVLADVNGDGAVDLVTVSDSGQVLVITPTATKWLSPWVATVEPVEYASPVYLDLKGAGVVVVATKAAGVYALDGRSGRVAWHARIAKNFYASPMVADANGDKVPDIIVVASNGDMHALDGATGDELWNLALGVAVRATPAPFDANGDGLDDIVVLDGAGNIKVVDMLRGRLMLDVPVASNDALNASPVLGDVVGDGLLEIVTASNKGQVAVFALNRETRRGQARWPMFLGRDGG